MCVSSVFLFSYIFWPYKEEERQRGSHLAGVSLDRSVPRTFVLCSLPLFGGNVCMCVYLWNWDSNPGPQPELALTKPWAFPCCLVTSSWGPSVFAKWQGMGKRKFEHQVSAPITPCQPEPCTWLWFHAGLPSCTCDGIMNSAYEKV